MARPKARRHQDREQGSDRHARPGALRRLLEPKLDADGRAVWLGPDTLALDEAISLTEEQAEMLLRWCASRALATAEARALRDTVVQSQDLKRLALDAALDCAAAGYGFSVLVGQWLASYQVMNEHFDHAEIARAVAHAHGADAGAAYLSQARVFRDGIANEFARRGAAGSKPIPTWSDPGGIVH